MKTVKVLLTSLAIVAAGLFMGSCGGSGNGVIPPPPVTIAISPTTASVVAGGSQQFAVTVTGSSDKAASWSVNNVPGGNATIGTVSATGLYAAPAAVPNPATVTVTATSQADATKSASASVTITPAPMPAASFQPSSLDFGSVNVTSNVSKTVTLTNSGNTTLTITNIAVTDTDDFSEINACGSSLAAGANCNIVVDFKPTAGGAITASLAVADNASGSPQSVPLSGTGVVTALTMTPTNPTVLLGATQPFLLNVNATCVSPLFGNMPVTSSGSTFTATYTVPQALPGAWNDKLNCTATVGGSQVSAQITLQYPVPTITGTSAQDSLGTLWGIQPLGGSFAINGSGFLSDANLNVLNDRFDICGVSQVNWTQMVVGIALSYVDFGVQCNAGNPQSSWDPGFIGFTVSDPATGHGGGTSNVSRLAFIGDQNLMAFNASDVFLLDPATSTVRKFKVADGSPDGSFTFTPGTGLAIAVDDVTGEVVVFTGTSTEAFDPVTNVKVYEEDAASPGTLHGGAVGGGWAVLSAYNGVDAFPGAMDAINLQQPGNPPIHVSYGFGTPQYAPWNFQVANLNGKPTEVVWSAYSDVLSTVDIATQTVIRSVALPNILTLSYTGYLQRGGWQLQVFNAGPLAGTAVLLSQYDQVLVYVDLATMTEIRRVDLTAPFKNANPPLPVLQSFRIGKDEADGSIVVAFADSVNGKTVLYNVDASGNMTPLGATQPFLATGLQESTDGTQIYWGNRSSFAITPKQ